MPGAPEGRPRDLDPGSQRRPLPRGDRAGRRERHRGAGGRRGLRVGPGERVGRSGELRRGERGVHGGGARVARERDHLQARGVAQARADVQALDVERRHAPQVDLAQDPREVPPAARGGGGGQVAAPDPPVHPHHQLVDAGLHPVGGHLEGQARPAVRTHAAAVEEDRRRRAHRLEAQPPPGGQRIVGQHEAHPVPLDPRPKARAGQGAGVEARRARPPARSPPRRRAAPSPARGRRPAGRRASSSRPGGGSGRPGRRRTARGRRARAVPAGPRPAWPTATVSTTGEGEDDPEVLTAHLIRA